MNRNWKWERKLNCSEGEVPRVTSPIRESILNSSRSRGRSSTDGHHRVHKQRSQHSLIIESVARILDDSCVEDRVKPLHDLTFKTGPPSEIYRFGHIG